MGMRKQGFTFIEMVVVMGILGISLPVLFGIFFGVFQQQTKIQRLSEVKRQGDYVFSVMETIIRNEAKAVFASYDAPNFATEMCASSDTLYQDDGTGFYFQDKNGNAFRFYLSEGKIASYSSKLASPRDLTSDAVVVSDFLLTCQRNNIGAPSIIKVSFDVSYNSTSTRAEEITRLLHYQTAIKLRNF